MTKNLEPGGETLVGKGNCTPSDASAIKRAGNGKSETTHGAMAGAPAGGQDDRRRVNRDVGVEAGVISPADEHRSGRTWRSRVVHAPFGKFCASGANSFIAG